jgi:hypothetical protein
MDGAILIRYYVNKLTPYKCYFSPPDWEDILNIIMELGLMSKAPKSEENTEIIKEQVKTLQDILTRLRDEIGEDNVLNNLINELGEQLND